MSHLFGRAVRKSFTALCRKADSALAKQALEMLANNDALGLVSMSIDARDYNDPAVFLVDNQIACFFKKYDGLDLGLDLKSLALDTFRENELVCFHTNYRLYKLIDDPLVYGERVAAFVKLLRKEVSRVLGRCPLISELNPRFGPGSTFGDVGPLTTVLDKMTEDATLTHDAWPCLGQFMQTAWGRMALEGVHQHVDRTFIGPVHIREKHFGHKPRVPQFIRGNRFTTVPKDAKKLRGICIEPSVNLFYQLGVGDWLTKRLGLVYGWSKVSVQERHREWAMLGSAFGHLATIDLSNASDTICRALVKLLLPVDWFDLLEMLRSKTTLIGTRWHHLEKFSSMGNGFTFELETLIFRAICEVVTPKGCPPEFGGDTVSTFGDDIVVPTCAAKDVVAALEFLGFIINKTKSFVDGDFRESCGGDFFLGKPVRAHYLKESPDEPHQLIALANGLRRFRIRHILCGGLGDYDHCRLRVLDDLPSNIRACKGPDALGDLVIHDDESKWKPAVRSSVRYFRVWRPVRFGKTGFHHFRPGVLFAAAIFGVPDGTPTSLRVLTLDSRKAASGFETRVNGTYVSGYRLGRVAYS